MKKTFVNFTNHPSKYWDKKQREEAEYYGKICDVPFPAVDPQGDEVYICNLAETCTEQILRLHPAAVLCQGEFCLAYQVVSRLQKKGILVLAACSERMVRMQGQKKEVVFVFQKFRKYEKVIP